MKVELELSAEELELLMEAVVFLRSEVRIEGQAPMTCNKRRKEAQVRYQLLGQMEAKMEAKIEASMFQLGLTKQ